MFIETSPRLGDQYGQILVGLHPKTPQLRRVEEMIEAMRAELTATPGPVQVSFLRLAGGPPTAKPISVKVRGDRYAEIRSACKSPALFLPAACASPHAPWKTGNRGGPNPMLRPLR